MFILPRPFISRVVLPFICLFTIAVATPAVTKPVFATPQAIGDYGSITNSRSLQKHFYAYGGSKEAAENNAWNRCWQVGRQAGPKFQNDCNSAVWVHNGYMSIAQGDNNRGGTGWGTSAYFAERYAKQICKTNGGINCQIKGTYHTNNPLSSAQGGPGFGSAVLERTFTKNGVGRGQEATTFVAGDVIWYVAQVNNQGSVKVNPTLYFEATGPQSILSWKRIASLDHTGVWYVYFKTTIPTNAPFGQYTLRVTLTFHSQSSTKASQFAATVPGKMKSVDDERWSGYAAVSSTANAYKRVVGSWKVPKLKNCLPAFNPAKVGYWIGLGGLKPGSKVGVQPDTFLIQAGTVSVCYAISQGTPPNYGFYEIIPTGGPVIISSKDFPVYPNDQIEAEVEESNTPGNFNAVLRNMTRNKVYPILMGADPNKVSIHSAEWITERPPTPSGYPPLAQFDVINWSGCYANNQSISAGPITARITMKREKNGPVLANPTSLITNDTFSVQWKQPD